MRCPLEEESVCLSSGVEPGKGVSFLHQPLSSQPWAALPPAGQAQPGVLPLCCRRERAPASWRQAPLAAAARSAAPQTVSATSAAEAPKNAERFLPRSEVKEP